MPTKYKPGNQKRREKRERDMEAQARHVAAQGLDAPEGEVPEPCADPMRAHLYQLRILLARQHELELTPKTGDGSLTLERRIYLTAQIAQALAKIKLEADLTQQLDEAERLLAQASSALKVERQQAERERRTKGLPAKVFALIEERAKKDDATIEQALCRAIEAYCAQ